MDISGSVAVVTGGSQGLGRAAVKELLHAGARVAILDIVEPNSPEGDLIDFFRVDVCQEDDVRAALTATAASRGPLRILVNCAGGGGRPSRVLTSQRKAREMSHFREKIELNLIGTFNVLRLGAEVMCEADLVGDERGVIINTSSTAAFEGQAGQVGYAAAKGAIASMTLPLARELAREAIRVVSIAPGIFGTERILDWPKERRDAIVRGVPHPSRLGYPSEFAALVRHVIENPMFNGTTIRLDAALRMQ